MAKVKLTSNWTPDNDSSISAGVQICSTFPTELPDLLSEEPDKSYVLVQKQKSTGKCSLNLLTAAASVAVSAVVVVSESKLVEVFVGKHGEYLTSFSGKVLQTLEDSIICKTEITLPKPQSQIQLVLKNTFDEESIMLYGIFAKTQIISPELSEGAGRFSSKHLDPLLSERSLTLSQNAAALKKMLGQYNDNIDSNAMKQLSNLMPMMGLGLMQYKAAASNTNIQNDANLSCNENSNVNNKSDALNPLHLTSIENTKGHSEEIVQVAEDKVLFSLDAFKNSLNLDLDTSKEKTAAFEKMINQLHARESSLVDECLHKGASNFEQFLSNKLHNTVEDSPSSKTTSSDQCEVLSPFSPIEKSDVSSPCSSYLSKNDATTLSLNHASSLDTPCNCHEIQKLIDNRLDQFETRIVSMIDEKFAGLTSQILSKLEGLQVSKS